MRLDQYLVHLHQTAVDGLQRRPIVFARFLTVIYIVTAAIQMLNKPEPVMLALYPLLAVIMLTLLTAERRYATLGNAKFVRLFLFILLGVEAFGNLFRPEVNFASFINSMAITSYYYFAACTPPKPPKRKEKTFLNLKGQT